MTVEAGTALTCSNTECGCRIEVQVPCPHGDHYVCGCGHAFEPAGSSSSGERIPPTPGA